MKTLALLLGLAFVAVFTAVLAVCSAGAGPGLEIATLLCLIVWVVGSLVLTGGDRRGIWSPGVIYFNVFAVFHFGLGLVYWSGGDVRDIPWFSDPAVPIAFMVVAWGGTALLFGLLIPDAVRWLLAQRSDAALDLPPQAAGSGEDRQSGAPILLPVVGLAVVVLSVLAWFAIVLPRVGGRIWGLPYGEFLLATDGAGLGWVYFWLALGFAMSVLPGARQATHWAIAVLAFWAVVALPIGLRGEVMFPVATALMIVSHRLKRIGLVTALVVGILFLSISAMFREVRREGWNGVDWGWKTVNPAAAVQELGQSLRPTFETVRWLEGGDPPLAGGSYWAPLERGFLRVFPLQERAEGETDRRLLNVLVMERVGPIGFSPVAEAHYNWGASGVFAVLAMIGAIVSILAVDPPSYLRQALMAAIYVPLLIHIRNSFAPVFAQMLLGLLVILALLLLEHWIRARRAPQPAPGRT